MVTFRIVPPAPMSVPKMGRGVLLELGLDPNGASDEELTTLLLAAASGHLSVARTLPARGADVNARCTFVIA